mgnify:CR=1 FL=1
MIVLPEMVGAQRAAEEPKRGMGSGIVFPGLVGSAVLPAQ